MSSDVILAEAKFNPKVRSYWLLSGVVAFFFGVITIPLIPIWLILGHYFTQRYLDHMSCTLTDRSVKVSKGLLVRQEKTVPLDKITDVALVEGPIMRYLDLQAVKIETAGSSAGAFLQIVGIQNTRDFRDQVLKQRDRISDGSARGESTDSTGAGTRNSPALTAAAASLPVELLTEIRDTLQRIERRLPAED